MRFFDPRCWNKMLPNFSKSYPKSSHSRIFLNSDLFQHRLKVQTILGYFYKTNETENFQKSLNLVTLMFHPRPPFKIIHHLVPLNLTLTFKRRWVDLVDEWLKIGHLASVTVWPDLAKFCHYGKILQVFGKCLMVHLLFDKMLGLFGQICYNIGLISIVSDDQIISPSGRTVPSPWSQNFPQKPLSKMSNRRINLMLFAFMEKRLSHISRINQLRRLVRYCFF